jgi:hypothetical protein
MKKAILIALSIVSVASVAACTKSHATPSTLVSETPAAQRSDQPASARIVVPAPMVRQNSTTSGYIEVDNPTSATLRLTDGQCRPRWAVAIENDQVHALVSFPDDCQLNAPLILPPGTTKLPFTISARYAACTSSPGSASPNTPMCDSRGQSPALPVGTYRVVFITPSGATDLGGISVSATTTVQVVAAG